MDVDAVLAELKTLRGRLAELETQLSSATQSAKADVTVSRPPEDPQRSLLDAGVPMACTRVVMNQIVMPSEVDTMGICIGGQVLSWIDVCAGMSAKSLARGPCVTASVDSVHFLKPCRLGTVVIIAAMVNRTFSSSMEVGVRVEAEDMRTGVRTHCCSANLMFVALPNESRGNGSRSSGSGRMDRDKANGTGSVSYGTVSGSRSNGSGRPKLPRVIPGSREQEQVYAEAEQRRERRLKVQQETLRDPDLAAATDESCRLRPITHRDGCPTLPPSIELHRSFDEVCANAAADGTPIARRPVTPDLTAAYMTQSIMPQNANTLHITFGGQVLAWMEQCAYISASRMRGPHCLTASMDSITFGRTTRVGDILYLTSQVTAIFGSSMEVMVSVHGEDPLVGELFHCADAYVTVVTVKPQRGVDDAASSVVPSWVPCSQKDGGGSDAASLWEKAACPVVGVDAYVPQSPTATEGMTRVTPVQLPFQLVPQTPSEIMRHKGALKRREARLQSRRALVAELPGRKSLDEDLGRGF